MEWLLWILIGLVFYTYLGYGILLYFLVRVKRIFKRPEQFEKTFEPPVTLVIPAYNEEGFIKAKAANSLQLDYPKDKLRILFITDGSSDETYRILQEIEGVEVIHDSRRAGKAAAENRAMKFVKTPIVVFCDANTQLNRDCIRQLVKHYQNEKVGAVAGAKKVISAGADSASGAGEGIYWKYESALKKWDSELYTVVGAAGELISFRTELVTKLEEDTILDDFMQSLRICSQGYRVVYEPNAMAVETASQNVTEELKRKVRIAAGGWQSMRRLLHLLNPLKNPLLTFQYVSHRVLRWSISAFALPLILLINVILLYTHQQIVYYVLLSLQIAFYMMAILGWVLENRKIRLKVLFIPYYFLMMNYAVFAGFWRWAKGRQASTWERAQRVNP